MYLRCLWLQYFLRSQFRAYLWSSTPNVLIFCDFISLSAFFMFGLWQFCYHVYRHGFLWVYSGFNELLRSVIRFFSSNWDFNHVSSYIYSMSFYLSCLFWGPYLQMFDCMIFPHGSLNWSFFFYLFLCIIQIGWFQSNCVEVFEPFLLFPIWHQAYESELFHFRYCYFSF